MIKQENPLIANSLWVQSVDLGYSLGSDPFKEFQDVVVIGGGFSGCSAAYHLIEKGLDVCLIEKQTIGWGASGRNGGQVNPGLKELPEGIISYYGPIDGERIVNLSGDAPNYVFNLIKKNRLLCDATQNGWIQASIGRRGDSINREVVRQYNKYKVPVELLSKNEISSLLGSAYYSGGTLDPRGGKLNPLKYIKGLAQVAQKNGTRIHENTEVLGIKKTPKGYLISCDRGELFATRVVLATNAYGSSENMTLNKNVIPVQSIQVATSRLSNNILKTIIPEGHVVSDTQRLLKYFRIADNGRLLMGGRGGTSNKTIRQQIAELKNHVRKMFPELADINFDYAWGGDIALTKDQFPHIIELHNGIISLSGYNGRGVAMATVLGKVDLPTLGRPTIANLKTIIIPDRKRITETFLLI